MCNEKIAKITTKVDSMLKYKKMMQRQVLRLPVTIAKAKESLAIKERGRSR